ncbi:MAG: hypothetical protein ACI9K2_007178 [Myxococcota bacterium]
MPRRPLSSVAFVLCAMAFVQCGGKDGGSGGGGGDTGDLPTPATTDSDGDMDTPCIEETVEFVDWMAPGTFGAGRSLHVGVTDLDGAEMPLEFQVTYPALLDGEDTPLAGGGPFPVIFFEHAYGADYLNSDWLLDRLASRGFVVFSAAHNGAWDSAGDWWGDHAVLFLATQELAASWNAADSPFVGALDLETTALMGHSHGGGAALQVMSDLEADAVVLITTRPSLDGAYWRYHEVYDGMPPMLNIVASRDEDGTTAYGTSVAVYEAVTRPRFMVTVEGASHYTFTDEASIAPSNIEREDGQIAGGSGIIAFLEYLLHDDRRGLHGLRGDVALYEGGAPSRLQSHPAGAWVIDDFENTVSAEGTAIAGIDGQTFVNGFMGDTATSFEEGVGLLVAEIEALSEAGDRVLFYQDASRGTDAYIEALTRVDRELTVLTDDAAFEAALADPWDLVVATQQDGNVSDVRPFDSALAATICGGGKAILSDFRHASATAAATFACAGAAFDGTTNWTRMTGTGSLFSGDMQVQNPGWGVFSTGLWTTQTVFATNDLVTEGVPDPSQGPWGPVEVSGLETFAEIDALDASRALYMPTQALELAWQEPGQVRWDLGDPVDATAWGVVALRVLQIHDDPLNPPVLDPGDVTLSVVLEDADGAKASLAIAVGPTLDWLESTVPKSVFQTERLALHDFGGVDPSRLVAISLVFDGSATGRILVDDLELSPGLECVPGG